MKRFLQTLCLFSFAFGVATIVKNYGVAQWLDKNPVIAPILMVAGAVGILMFFGEEG